MVYLKKDKNKALVLVILVFTILIFCVATPNNWNSNFPQEKIHTSTIFYDILIDDLTANNWTWAKNQGYCIGSGNETDPYIIDGHQFYYNSGTGDCLAIKNSIKHFVIQDCDFVASDSLSAGLYLLNISNGQIRSSNFQNNFVGIKIEKSSNLTIAKNDFDTNEMGMFLDSTNRTKAFLNSFIGNNNAIKIINSHLVQISSGPFTIIDLGIFFEQCFNLELFNVSLDHITEIGFVLKECVNISISFVSIVSNDNYGFYLTDCLNCTFSNIDMRLANCGVFMEDSHNNYFYDVHISDHATYRNGTGFYLINSNYNVFNLTSINNIYNGTVLIYSNNNYFFQYASEDTSGNGLNLIHSNNNRFEYGACVNNSFSGIYGKMCTNTTFSNLLVEFNRQSGIVLTSCFETNIHDCYFYGNDLYSISMIGCIKNNISRNTVENSMGGLMLIGCIENWVAQNDIGINEGDGATMLLCDDTSIVKNYIYKNDKNGLSLLFCSNNRVIQNSITDNQNSGISLNFSIGNNIIGNTISENYYGIFMEKSNDSLIVVNNLIGNTYCIVEIECKDNRFIDNTCEESLDFAWVLLLGFLISSIALNFVLAIIFIKKRGRRGEK